MKLTKQLVWVLLLLSSFSCVATKKFNTMQKNLTDEIDQLKAQNEKLSVENLEMKSKLDKLTVLSDYLIQDSVQKFNEMNQLKKDLAIITRNYEELQLTQEDLLKGNARETARLMKQLQGSEEELQKKEDKLEVLERDLNDKQVRLNMLEVELNERNAKMMELESILHRKDSAVMALKNKVTEALLGFEKDGLAVRIQNGKVYVSLEEKLLFKSGSTEVDPKGVSALKKLSKVLEQNQDINITIEGHTDDVPVISSPSIKDNWDLSVKRATAIVRILLDGSQIHPKRLTASGRGEFVPVDATRTSEGRQKNRRTEIILTPKLDELFQILESN